MEGREPSAGLSPATASSLQQAMGQGGASFSAILQRGPMPGQQPQPQQQQQQQQPGIHVPSGPPPGLHAPAAMRPASVGLSSPNPAYPGDGSVPLMQHQLSGGMGVGMGVGVRPGEPVKRKRGRPRKYGEGASGGVSLALTPLSSANPISPPTEKRRGRPPGSGKKQQLAALGAWLAGSAGQGFTPHVITIAAGEDVATKIMSFSQTGPRAVCVLSANGAISNVTLRQPATSGGTVTYEGRFEILSLSGSFLLTESGGTRSRTGGLSVSLAGPDGRVVGGGVAGLLMAASPVQVVVGSFIADTRKTAVPRPAGDNNMPAQGASGSGGVQRPPKNDSGQRSPDSPHLEQSSGGGGNLMHSQVQGMGSLQSMGWPSSQSLSEPRRDTDINISLPGG